MPCRYWPARAGTPVNVNGARVPGVLLIEETNDAATPWAGAIEVRKRYPGAVLIEGVGGTTHAGSLSGVSCTDDRIATYLLTGALPAGSRVTAPTSSASRCHRLTRPRRPVPLRRRGAAPESTTGCLATCAGSSPRHRRPAELPA